MSFKTQKIPFDDHCQWFQEKIRSRNSLFYIAENQNKIPIGQARFDMSNGEVLISVSLRAEYRKLGIGTRLIIKAGERCLREWDPDKVVALIKRENIASRHAFEKAGYQPDGNGLVKGNKAFRMTYSKA